MRALFMSASLLLSLTPAITAWPSEEARFVEKSFRSWREKAAETLDDFQQFVAKANQHPEESFDLPSFLVTKKRTLVQGKMMWKNTERYLDYIKNKPWNVEDTSFLSTTRKQLTDLRIQLLAQDWNIGALLLKALTRSRATLQTREEEVRQIPVVTDSKLIEQLYDRPETTEEKKRDMMRLLLDNQVHLGAQISKSQDIFLVGKMWSQACGFMQDSKPVVQVVTFMDKSLGPQIAAAKELYDATFDSVRIIIRRFTLAIAKLINKTAGEILEITGKAETNPPTNRGVISGAIKHASRYSSPDSSRTGSRMSPRTESSRIKDTILENGQKKVSFNFMNTEEQLFPKIDATALQNRLEDEANLFRTGRARSPPRSSKNDSPYKSPTMYTVGNTALIQEKLKPVDETLKRGLTWVFDNYQDLYHNLNLKELAQTVEGNFNILLDAYKKLYAALPSQNKHFKWIDWRLPLTAISFGADLAKPVNHYWLDEIGMSHLREKLKNDGPTPITYKDEAFFMADEDLEPMRDDKHWMDLRKTNFMPGEPMRTPRDKERDTDTPRTPGDSFYSASVSPNKYEAVIGTPSTRRAGPTQPLFTHRGDDEDENEDEIGRGFYEQTEGER